MKPRFFSKKTFICDCCHRESEGNFNSEAKQIICWKCVFIKIFGKGKKD